MIDPLDGHAYLGELLAQIQPAREASAVLETNAASHGRPAAVIPHITWERWMDELAHQYDDEWFSLAKWSQIMVDGWPITSPEAAQVEDGWLRVWMTANVPVYRYHGIYSVADWGSPAETEAVQAIARTAVHELAWLYHSITLWMGWFGRYRRAQLLGRI